MKISFLVDGQMGMFWKVTVNQNGEIKITSEQLYFESVQIYNMSLPDNFFASFCNEHDCVIF